MARHLNRLTARSVATLKKPGRHADGQCLYLKISADGVSKSWVFMFDVGGRQREGGLGSASAVSLAQARSAAAEWRSLLAKGIDPLDAKRATSAAAATRKTFGECASELIASKRAEWRNASHARQWQQTLGDFCAPIWDRPVDAIDTQAVLSVLKPVWAAKPETASRLRGRIEAVLDFAKAHKLRAGENPAAWKGNLALILPRRQKLSKVHLAAMPYRDVAAFIATLREIDSIRALALEFLVLTAARLGEVLGARWAEIDLTAKTWTIPAGRMKAGREHQDSASFPRDRDRRADGRDPEQRLHFSGAKARASSIALRTPRALSFRRDHSRVPLGFSRLVWRRNIIPARDRRASLSACHRRRGRACLSTRRCAGEAAPLMEAWAQYCEPSAGGNILPMTRRTGAN